MRILKALAAVLLITAVALVAFVQIAPATALRLGFDAERSRSGLVRKEIDLPDGLHYVYLEGGSGEPLVLLHGFGDNKDTFTRLARFLTGKYRVIAPDHIGFGESSRPMDADYTPPAQAERLHALTIALGLDRVHVGGNSMGGHIALSWAAAHPGDVASLWLLDAAGIWSAPKSELTETIEKTGVNPLNPTNTDEFLRLYQFAMSDPPYVPRAILDVMAEQRIANAELEAKIFQQLRTDDAEERIRGMRTPSLIVWGDEDRALHVGTAEVLHGLLPNSEVVILEGIGHLPQLEAPERCAEDYLRFREGAGRG